LGGVLGLRAQTGGKTILPLCRPRARVKTIAKASPSPPPRLTSGGGGSLRKIEVGRKHAFSVAPARVEMCRKGSAICTTPSHSLAGGGGFGKLRLGGSILFPSLPRAGGCVGKGQRFRIVSRFWRRAVGFSEPNHDKACFLCRSSRA